MGGGGPLGPQAWQEANVNALNNGVRVNFPTGN